jgi:hypothetical protein
MDRTEMSVEGEIAYEAAKAAIAHVRLTLLLMSALIGIGFFFLFNWHASWELTRAEGRRAVAAEIRRINSQGGTVTGSTADDQRLAETMKKTADALEEEHANHEFEVPLLRLRVSSPDFPVAILIVALALLLWLLFYNRKVNECLTYLRQKQGWSLVGHLLKFQFIVIGKHASRPMQLAARFLPMGLPVLAIFFLISDCVDLYGFWRDPIKKLVFTSGAYDARVAFRLLLEIALAGLVGYFGTKCRKEFQSSEEELTHFSEEYNRSARATAASKTVT